METPILLTTEKIEKKCPKRAEEGDNPKRHR
jgi:hypothetical protein